MTAESPIRRLRLLSGLQQKELAERAGVSVTALVQIEQGRYERIPQRVNLALARACRDAGVAAMSTLMTEYGDASLDGAMRTWQRRKRQEYDLSGWPSLDLTRLIEQFGNQDRFSKALCIPIAALHNYRSGKLRIMPTVIAEALDEAGYRYTESVEVLTDGIRRYESESVQGG